MLEIDTQPQTWVPPELTTPSLTLRALMPSEAGSIFEYAGKLYKERAPEPLGFTFRESTKKVIGTVGCFWVSKPSQSMELAYYGL